MQKEIVIGQEKANGGVWKEEQRENRNGLQTRSSHCIQLLLIPWAGIPLPPLVYSPLFSTVTLPPEFDLCEPHQAALSGISFQWDQLEDSHCQSFWSWHREVCGC